MLLALLCGSRPPAAAEDFSLAGLKARFLGHFVTFAQWPPDATRGEDLFTYCIAGDRAVAEALTINISRSRSRVAKRVDVVLVTADGPFVSCHLLFLGGLDATQHHRVLQSIGHAPIFTVSDADGFAERGGIAQLRVEKGQMRFSINLAAAQRARISLSSKLLSLATLVKDAPDERR